MSGLALDRALPPLSFSEGHDEPTDQSSRSQLTGKDALEQSLSALRSSMLWFRGLPQ